MKFWLIPAAALFLMACEPSGDNAKSPADPAVLLDKKWKVTEVGGTSTAEESKAAFTFTQSGRYGGNTGCNSTSGAASFDGAQVSLEPGPMTKMACPDPLMAQEQAVVTALTAADTWSMDGETLVFHNADGAEVIRFTRAQGDPAN